MKDKNIIIAITTLMIIALFLSTGLQVIKAQSQEDTLSIEEKEEILWLARIVYSETKSPNEQVLIAWVVRNRVEAEYKGATYEEVASRSSQFSGLNMFDRQYRHNITRNYDSPGRAWENALSISEAVYFAPNWLRPFAGDVKHFYSPKSVRLEPEWAADHKPVLLVKDSKRKYVRFAFYSDIK
jgi:spore germination cell wall hydrolase CwlJ-like protein